MTIGAVDFLSHSEKGEVAMPRYIVEREISGASTFTARELHDVSQKSINALRQMGTKIQWVQSYIARDKMYCEYIAPDEEMIWEHAQKGGFPISRVSRIQTVIDPTTAEWR